MRRIRFIFIFLLLLTGATQLHAAKGIDPVADSLAVERMKARMREIRKHRPTVALVLSGGGAKGAAHVGVIKYIESLGIPVDLVLGTSMGGLVGGLYSLGYTSGELDALLRSIDWNWALYDQVSREDKSYLRAKYEEKYLLSMPFYYDEDYYAKKEKVESAYDVEKKHSLGFEIGAGDVPNSEAIKKNLLGSLPSGYVKGQNVSNLINALTVGYQDEIDFFELPIPFVCIAADMMSGKAKIWYDGKINTAMRSTMSVPGLFAPVKDDGMVLVDGGLRNNYPTDLARKMGADIIIGVELSDQKKVYTEVNNIIDIASQAIDMLGQTQFEANENLADVKIKPELTGYNMMSFEPEKIDTIISRGYAAAKNQDTALREVAKKTSGKYRIPEKKPAMNIESAVDTVLISDIEVTGVANREKELLKQRLNLKPGTYVSYKEIQKNLTNIYATKNYESVTFELLGEAEPFKLVVHCVKGPIHNLGIGARIDSEELVSVLINVGLFKHRLYGHTVDLTGKIGVNPYFEAQWYYDMAHAPRFNAKVNVRWTSPNFLDYVGRRYSMTMLSTSQSVFISTPDNKLVDASLGFRNDYYYIGQLLGSDFAPDYDYGQLKNDFMSAFAKFRIETYDKKYFSNRGYSVGGSYSWVFGGFPHSFDNFHIVSFDARAILSTPKKIFSFIPSVNFRFLLGGRDIPFAYFNIMGGSLEGRFFEQQIPFIGVSNAVVANKILTNFRTDFRFNVHKNHYLRGIVNYSRSCSDFTDYVNNAMDHIGCAVEYSYNSIFGPLSVNFNWSTLNKKKLGFYISLGYDF